jgi:serine/threonine protein kinase
LRNEIKTHRFLDHPFIIRFIDCIQIEHLVYILLEYATNGSLFHYIHPHKGLPEAVAFRFLYQTGLAVKYLHDMKVVHRDIKPENILMDDGMNVKVCDFGWSANIEDDEARTTVCGTLEYMPPEIINEQTHNSKADLWCLGVMLYEMTQGRSPFAASSLTELKTAIKKEKIVFRPETSDEAKDLILQLMEFDVDKRMDIDSLLIHPALMKRYDSFFQPIAKDDYEVLIQNYYDVKYPKPGAFQAPKPQRMIDVRVHQGETSKLVPIPVPDVIEQIEGTLVNIQSFLREEHAKRQTRHSETTAAWLQKPMSETERYRVALVAESSFMSVSIIRNAIAGRHTFHPSGKMILLERKINWKPEFYRTEAEFRLTGEILFVIYYESILDVFMIEVVPYENERNVVRKLIRKDLRGRRRTELAELTNLPDFEFCHVTGVKAGCRSLVSAMLVADLSL